MKKHRAIPFILLIVLPFPGFSQFLSNLDATRNDALYTTYAAPLSRSDYKTDQGYHFMWYDDENGVQFISKDGLNLGLAFRVDGEFKSGAECRFPRCAQYGVHLYGALYHQDADTKRNESQ